MSDRPLTGDATAASNGELLERIGMLSGGEDIRRSRPLADQLALTTGKPVAVSYDREGIIVLESGAPIEQGERALIAADVHFTTQSIQAAASGVEQAGMRVSGAAILLRVTRGGYPFPVWALEDRT